MAMSMAKSISITIKKLNYEKYIFSNDVTSRNTFYTSTSKKE